MSLKRSDNCANGPTNDTWANRSLAQLCGAPSLSLLLFINLSLISINPVLFGNPLQFSKILDQENVSSLIMSSLQLPGCRKALRPLRPATSSSSFWGRDLCFVNAVSFSISKKENSKILRLSKRTVRVYAMSSNGNGSSFKMNLNEYMVTLEKPFGIRFALSVDGKILVHALKKGVLVMILVFFFPLLLFNLLDIKIIELFNFQGNAERSRIVMVGDTLKKVTNLSSGRLVVFSDLGDAQ